MCTREPCTKETCSKGSCTRDLCTRGRYTKGMYTRGNCPRAQVMIPYPVERTKTDLFPEVRGANGTTKREDVRHTRNAPLRQDAPQMRTHTGLLASNRGSGNLHSDFVETLQLAEGLRRMRVRGIPSADNGRLRGGQWHDYPTASDEGWSSAPPIPRVPYRQPGSPITSPGSQRSPPTPPPSTVGINAPVFRSHRDSFPRGMRTRMHRNSNESEELDVDDDQPSP